MSKDMLYPLRRLRGWLGRQAANRKRLAGMKKLLRENRHARALIPGTPPHGNLGDSAIVLAQKAFLSRCGIPAEDIFEIGYFEYLQAQDAIPRYIHKNMLIAQLGGGNMGSQWKWEEDLHRRIVTDFPQNPMVIFPQTIYYAPDARQQAEESKAVYNGRKNLTMAAREQPSFEIMSALYPDTRVLLMPDIVLSAAMEDFGAKPQERKGVLLCMRSDAERAMTDADRQAVEQAVAALGESFRGTDMHTQVPVTRDNRAALVKEKMEEIAGARLVITDRLHGMVLAAVTGTPCIVFGNYNHKVRGTYEWIQYLPYVRYVQTPEQAQQLLPQMLAMGGQVYDNGPLQPYFEELARVVREYVGN